MQWVPVCQVRKSQFPGFHSAISGHRYYNPSLGRFLGRDPAEEKGGLHLYAFCENNAVNRWDMLGMDGSGGGLTIKYIVDTPGYSYSMNGVTMSQGQTGHYSITTNDTGHDIGVTDMSAYQNMPIASDGGTNETDGGVTEGAPSTAGFSASAKGSDAFDRLLAGEDPEMPANASIVTAGPFMSHDNPGQVVGTSETTWGANGSTTVSWGNNSISSDVNGGSGVTVLVGYDTVNGTLGVGIHGATIFVDNSTGSVYVSQGNPSGTPGFLGLDRLDPGANTLEAAVQPWGQSTAGLGNFQYSGELPENAKDVLGDVIQYNNEVNAEHLPYSGSSMNGYNSNSYYTSVLREANLPVPKPPYMPARIPGTQRTIPVPTNPFHHGP